MSASLDGSISDSSSGSGSEYSSASSSAASSWSDADYVFVTDDGESELRARQLGLFGPLGAKKKKTAATTTRPKKPRKKTKKATTTTKPVEKKKKTKKTATAAATGDKKPKSDKNKKKTKNDSATPDKKKERKKKTLSRSNSLSGSLSGSTDSFTGTKKKKRTKKDRGDEKNKNKGRLSRSSSTSSISDSGSSSSSSVTNSRSGSESSGRERRKASKQKKPKKEKQTKSRDAFSGSESSSSDSGEDSTAGRSKKAKRSVSEKLGDLVRQGRGILGKKKNKRQSTASPATTTTASSLVSPVTPVFVPTPSPPVVINNSFAPPQQPLPQVAQAPAPTPNIIINSVNRVKLPPATPAAPVSPQAGGNGDDASGSESSAEDEEEYEQAAGDVVRRTREALSAKETNPSSRMTPSQGKPRNLAEEGTFPTASDSDDDVTMDDSDSEEDDRINENNMRQSIASLMNKEQAMTKLAVALPLQAYAFQDLGDRQQPTTLTGLQRALTLALGASADEEYIGRIQLLIAAAMKSRAVVDAAALAGAIIEDRNTRFSTERLKPEPVAGLDERPPTALVKFGNSVALYTARSSASAYVMRGLESARVNATLTCYTSDQRAWENSTLPGPLARKEKRVPSLKDLYAVGDASFTLATERMRGAATADREPVVARCVMGRGMGGDSNLIRMAVIDKDAVAIMAFVPSNPAGRPEDALLQQIYVLYIPDMGPMPRYSSARTRYIEAIYARGGGRGEGGDAIVMQNTGAGFKERFKRVRSVFKKGPRATLYALDEFIKPTESLAFALSDRQSARLDQVLQLLRTLANEGATRDPDLGQYGYRYVGFDFRRVICMIGAGRSFKTAVWSRESKSDVRAKLWIPNNKEGESHRIIGLHTGAFPAVPLASLYKDGKFGSRNYLTVETELSKADAKDSDFARELTSAPTRIDMRFDTAPGFTTTDVLRLSKDAYFGGFVQTPRGGKDDAARPPFVIVRRAGASATDAGLGSIVAMWLVYDTASDV
jgi:hypothetical protein